MTNHTPGPWSAGEPEEVTYPLSPPRWHCAVGAGGGVPIAFVYNGGTRGESSDRESVLANARLIAAAPALVEALSQLVQYYVRPHFIACLTAPHRGPTASEADRQAAVKSDLWVAWDAAVEALHHALPPAEMVGVPPHIPYRSPKDATPEAPPGLSPAPPAPPLAVGERPPAGYAHLGQVVRREADRLAFEVRTLLAALSDGGRPGYKLLADLGCRLAAYELAADEEALLRACGDPDLVEEEDGENRRCESGLPDCGPVTSTDAEGVPLCERCAQELAKDPRNHAVECPCEICSPASRAAGEKMVAAAVVGIAQACEAAAAAKDAQAADIRDEASLSSMKCPRCELREAPEHDGGDCFRSLCAECLLAVRPGLFRASPPQPGVAWHREFAGALSVRRVKGCTFVLHPDAWLDCRRVWPGAIYGFEDDPRRPFPTLFGQPLLPDDEVPVGVLEARCGAVTIRLPLARPK